MRVAGIATQYFCFGIAMTTATFARDSVSQNAFQHGETETSKLVEARAQKRSARNCRFKIAALTHHWDGERHQRTGGSSAIQCGGGVRLACTPIRGSGHPGRDAPPRSGLGICDGTFDDQQFQGGACCGAE